MPSKVPDPVEARVADPRFIGPTLDVGEVPFRTPGSEDGIELVAQADPVSVADEPRVGGEVGAAEEVAGKPAPFAITRRAQHDRMAVGGGVGAVRSYHR